MKNIIKYTGGKAKEIPLFERYIPNSFNTYIEPFFGGGATFFFLEPEKSLLNDVNKPLMNFYQDIRDYYALVREQLDKLQNIYESNQEEYDRLKHNHPKDIIENKNESLYYDLRDMFNHKKASTYRESVLFYFINKTAFSGMIRYNSKGEYNVPFGRYKHFNTKTITEKHSLLLQNSELFCTDYKDLFEMASPDDFMFLDPPYDTIFNDYGNTNKENGFDENDHRRLAADFKNLSCRTMMIIGKTPLTYELYANYIIDSYNKSYAVNIKNRFRSIANHIIVTNYKMK